VDKENENLTAEELKDFMAKLLEEMRNSKPVERSEEARRYTVTITELEKTFAYFKVFVVDYIFTGGGPLDK
jgi:hypothetical protein